MVYKIYYIIYIEFRNVSLSNQMYGIYNILYYLYGVQKISLTGQCYGIYNILYNIYGVQKGFSQWPDVWYIQFII